MEEEKKCSEEEEEVEEEKLNNERKNLRREEEEEAEEGRKRRRRMRGRERTAEWVSEELTGLYIWSTGQLQSKGNFVFSPFEYRLPSNITNLTNGRGVNCNNMETFAPPAKAFKPGS